ncbi:MAG: thioredoxin [Flavobacteriales bacterium]
MKAIESVSEFNNLVKEGKPVFLDFYADWCGPCQTLLPTVEKLAEEFKGSVEVRKVNVDTQREIATKFGIRSIPALFFMKGNKVLDKANGALPESELRNKLNSLVNAN